MALKSANGHKAGARKAKPKMKKLKPKGGNKVKKVLKGKASPMPSSSSPTAKPKVAKKRVSFAATLERSKLLEEITGTASVSTPEISPSKSILKHRKIALKADNKENEQPRQQEEKAADTPVRPASEKMLHRTKNGGVGKPVRKTKKVVTVKKSIKEKLLEMPKAERKAFLLKLKEKHKPLVTVAEQTKKIWERMRSKKCPKEEKEKCVVQIMDLIRGNAKGFVYAHDTCRVIQCLLALKREDIRTELFDELVPEIVRMTKSKYSKFFVQKMLKYGTPHQRNIIMRAFDGHCVRLLRISHAAQVLECAYNDHANAEQRNRIVTEFYGNEYVLFRTEEGRTPSLQEIARKSPAKIAPIMKNLDEVLQAVVEKETLRLSLTHKLLLDFLTYCSSEQRANMIDQLKDHLPEISHTREGSRAGMLCVFHADPKERKAIVKSFKGLAVKSALDEFSRRLLFAIFDTVDDTVLVNKYITKEIADNVADVANDKFGVWTLHYLVHPRHYHVFGKGLIELLRQGDDNEHSKKSASDRYTQLFDFVKKPLFTYMAANMREIISNKVSSVLVLDALEPNDSSSALQREIDREDKEACFRAIAEMVADEFIPHSMEEQPHIVQGGCARFVLMKLLKADRDQTDVKLSDFLAELPLQQLSSFVGINNGCFVLLNMAQSGSKKAREVARRAINAKDLKARSFVGAKLLLEEYRLQ